MEEILLLVISFGLCFVFFSICFFFKNVYTRAMKESKEREAKRRELNRLVRLKEEEVKKKYEERIQNEMKKREELYGPLTKSISLPGKKPLEGILIYAESKVIFIYDKEYKFSDIISCNLDIKKELIKGKEKIIHTTPSDWEKAKYKSDHIFSGKKLVQQTTIERLPDIEKQYYTIFIGVNDLVNPTIQIDCGKDVVTANDINATINVIVVRNK